MAGRDIISRLAVTGETADIVLPLSGAQHSTLHYRAAVMEGIRRHAVDKFMSIPRGGLEVGGLLLGRVDGEAIEVTDSEEFVVEYTNGPSYRFTAADNDKLRERLRTSPEQVVGWWHSHTRSEIDLSDEDLTLHREFFPAAHTVALVIKPFKFDPAQVAVYLPNSSSDPLAACARFALEGPKPKPREALVAASAPVVVPIARRSSEPPLAVSQSGQRRRSYAAVAGLVAVLLGAAWLAVPSRTPEPPPQTLGLTLSNAADQLTVRWDRNAELIQSSVGGELIITDGPQTTRIPLAIDSLIGGTLAYMRRSGNVEVRLRARSRDNQLHEAVAHFVGPEPKPRPEPITVERHVASDPNVERMKAEVERLNGEITRMRTAPKPAPPPPVVASRTAPAANLPAAQTFTAPPPNITPAPAPSTSNAPVTLQQVAAAPPPTAVPVAQPQQQPAKSAQLSRGRAIWTGMLPRGAVLAFDGRRPSSGALTGRMPDGPSRVRVYPGDLREAGIVVYTQGDRERIESPSAANGWNLTTYKPDAKRARDVAVLETPSPANNWQRIMVRSEQRPISILVVEWEEVTR